MPQQDDDPSKRLRGADDMFEIFNNRQPLRTDAEDIVDLLPGVLSDRYRIFDFLHYRFDRCALLVQLCERVAADLPIELLYFGFLVDFFDSNKNPNKDAETPWLDERVASLPEYSLSALRRVSVYEVNRSGGR